MLEPNMLRGRMGDLLVGVLFKWLMLAFGGAYLLMVSVTNLINFLGSVTSQRWKYLNSGNSDYISSIVSVYGWPRWFDELAVLGAGLVEGVGALLFLRAILSFRGHGTGIAQAYHAFAWNLCIWFLFIMGTEFFVAYPSEGPFRELMTLGLLMPLVFAIVPDDPISMTSSEKP